MEQRKIPENVDYLLQYFSTPIEPSIVLVRFCVSCKNCSVMDYERFLCIIYLSHTDRIMMMSSDQRTVRRKFPVDDDAKTFILPTYFENETTTRVCVLWRKSHKIPPSLNREIIWPAFLDTIPLKIVKTIFTNLELKAIPKN